MFGFIFGPEWRVAGSYAAAMMPLGWTRFVSSPLSSAFYIHGKQRILLVFQIILLAVIAVTMTIAFRLTWSLQKLLVVQSLFLGGSYIALLYFVRRTIIHSIATDFNAEPIPQ